MSKSDLQKAEALSALMDGEADEMELRRILKDVDADSELRASWQRYQLASAALRRDLPDQLVDLSAAVHEAVAKESRPAQTTQRWLKPLGRFAVAASVTAIAVFGMQQYGLQQSGVPIAAIESPETEVATPTQLPSNFAVPQLPVRVVSATSGNREPQRPVEIKQVIPDQATRDQVQRYLNGLMLRHTENAALNTNQGMMPFARMPNKQGEP